MIKKLKVTLCVSLFIIYSTVLAVNFNVENVYNSVVVIYSDNSVGSGFAINKNKILTNSHVISNNDKAIVKLYNGRTFEGKVIKRDEYNDLAVLEVDANLTPLKFKENDKNIIGEEVYAIGAPKDMEYSITKGIISSINRDIQGKKYLQIDAAVNPGNSGGPLVDSKSNVIGVITLKEANAEGIGFAIKTNTIKKFLNNEILIKSESDFVKIFLVLSIMVNIVLIIINLKLVNNNKINKNNENIKEKDNNKKVDKVEKEDEFDFEIEIND